MIFSDSCEIKKCPILFFYPIQSTLFMYVLRIKLRGSHIVFGK